jgi:phthalate 4,5-cis-dihydrodiol dehydrogenase
MTGNWDRARPTEGAYAALLSFGERTFASLTYNGFGHYDSDELTGWIGELGQPKPPYAGGRRRFADRTEEAAYKSARNYGGSEYRSSAAAPAAHQHFGLLLASCEHADLRAMPDSIMIYREGTARREPLAPPSVPRAEVIDELYDAVVHGKPPLHDGVWALATLEVLLAMLRSARERCDVTLVHQVAAP